jgi:CDP-diacylglycerol--glycerol-3-phosphate 3-phosphatidyltransferase
MPEIKKQMPNILSCIRIAGAFSLPFLTRKSWEAEIALPLIGKTFSNVPLVWIIVYLILLCSDKLDGTLARKLNAESELGAALDTIGDVLVLAIGATCCFVFFVRDNLGTRQFWIYVGMMVTAVLSKVLVFMVCKFYFGKGNMIHSYYSKAFAAATYVAIVFWAVLRTIPAWSICSLIAIIIYATIDECVYLSRTAEYNVDFKGHGFEKYKLKGEPH